MPRPPETEDAPAPSATELCRLAADALGVERVSLWRREGGAGHLEREVLYEASGEEARSGGRIRRRDVPWIGEAPGEVDVLAVRDVSAEASPLRSVHPIYFGPVGVRSVLQVPFRPGPGTLGLLWVEHTGAPRTWTGRERRAAETLVDWWLAGRDARPRRGGGRSGGTVARALRAAAEDTSLGVFVSDGTRVTAGSRAIRELLDVEPGDLESGVPLDSFLPEDVAEALSEDASAADGSAREPRTVPIRRPDGEIRWALLAVTAAGDPAEDGAASLAGWAVDVTALKDRERELAELAYSDPLTGLANRRLLHEQGERAVALAGRHDRLLALLYLDLTGFKRVNDAFGHAAGDEALVGVASRLQEQFRASDVVARIGGDEFAVLLTEVEGRPGAVEAAERVIERVGEPMDLGEGTVRLGGAVGIALFPRHTGEFSSLLKAADRAMYQAKRTAGPQVRVHAADEREEESSGGAVTPEELRTALRRDRLTLAYQPVFPARSDRAVGAEALLRLRREGRRPIPAARFVPVAERTDDIGRFDLWVVRRVVECAGGAAGGFPEWLSANVSSRTVAEERWVRLLAEESRSMAAVRGRGVCLEVPWPGDGARGGPDGGAWTAESLRERLSVLQEAGFSVVAELTSVAPPVLTELAELDPRGVKVPQPLLREFGRRTGAAPGHIVAWMQAGWECPVTVSRLDDPRLVEELEALEVDLYLQGRELCPPVEERELSGGDRAT